MGQTERPKATTPHYQTFPTDTPPPKSKGQPLSEASSHTDVTPDRPNTRDSTCVPAPSPLPLRQLLVLAMISLSEQTALNSISPYLPRMASTFPDIAPDKVGLYVGIIVSAFATAQFPTSFYWGYLSDRIGRKPVILLGTILTACCFLAFGFVQTFYQAIAVQIVMGLVNGNQGVVSTCLGEITDRSNQSKAFIYLPLVYGIGGITGPMLGGLLVDKHARFSEETPYPYLKPNLLAVAVLAVDLFVCMLFLEESLERAKSMPPLKSRLAHLFVQAWQLTNPVWPSCLCSGRSRATRERGSIPRYGGSPQMSDDDTDDESDGPHPETALLGLIPRRHDDFQTTKLFTRDTVFLLSTYFLFQLSNISYNTLYPVFGQAKPPRGRKLSPEEIGSSLAFAAVATIGFQLGAFGRLKAKLGNRTTYRICQAGMACAFFITPFVGYKKYVNNDGQVVSGKSLLWAELGLALLIKSLAAVGCLTSFLLLLTNSAPDHSVLGRLNGLAQTLSAAGRALGPLLSGALFSAMAHVEPSGEAVAFGIFGGVSIVAFILSFGVRGKHLEAEEETESEDEEGEENDDSDDDVVNVDNESVNTETGARFRS